MFEVVSLSDIVADPYTNINKLLDLFSTYDSSHNCDLVTHTRNSSSIMLPTPGMT